MTSELQTRFENFFEKTPDSCWIWKGAITSSGYGAFAVQSKTIQQAHRVSYTLYVGLIGPGKLVRHLCHNRACVNPDHLLPGSDQDNADDRRAAGRSADGENANRGGLTLEHVRQIRHLLTQGAKQKDLARIFNISPQTISDIYNGRRWKYSK